MKGLHPPTFVWRVGLPAPTTPQDRSINTEAYGPATGKVDLIMDLLDDQKVPLSLQWTDDVGQPVSTPADASASYSVDDPSIVNLIDNGDGTAVAAAVGALGTANVHVDVVSGGATLSGDLQLVIVASQAARVTISAGAPAHV